MTTALADVWTPRRSWAREVLDPDGTLPWVSLVPNGHFSEEDNVAYTGVRSRSFKVYSRRRAVGMADIANFPESGDWHFSNVRLNKKDPSYRKGMGMATYLLAIEAAHGADAAFATDFSLSEDAKQMWDRFIRAGIAVVETPIYVNDLLTADSKEIQYSGEVRILPGWVTY